MDGFAARRATSANALARSAMAALWPGGCHRRGRNGEVLKRALLARTHVFQATEADPKLLSDSCVARVLLIGLC